MATEWKDGGWLKSEEAAPEEQSRTPEETAYHAPRGRCSSQVQIRRRDRKRKQRLALVLSLAATALAALVVLVVLAVRGLSSLLGGESIDMGAIPCPSWIDQQFIDLGGGRDGAKIDRVKDIAIHYVGNPDTTAKANRNYFNTPGVEVSSHFIVGLEGEIVQCVPLDEKSAATNQRNIDTSSIEVCHPDETGRFNDKTYASLVKLCAWLCQQLDLDETHLIRHYDVTGKSCPLYYVVHEDAWAQLKKDVGTYLKEHETIS